jgi:hypothetical protein
MVKHRASRKRPLDSCDETSAHEQFIRELNQLHNDPYTTVESRQNIYSNNHFEDWSFLPAHLRYFVMDIDDLEAGPASVDRAPLADEGDVHSGDDMEVFDGSALAGTDDLMDLENKDNQSFDSHNMQSVPFSAPQHVPVAQDGGSSSNIMSSRESFVPAAVAPSMPNESHLPSIVGTSSYSYIRAVDTALSDQVQQVYQPLPVVSCGVDDVSMFCLPSVLEDDVLNFYKVNMVMVRPLQNGAFEIMCDCDLTSDLAVTMSMLSMMSDPAAFVSSDQSPPFSDLCQHSRALLYCCRHHVVSDSDHPLVDPESPDSWWRDTRQLNSLMAFASRGCHRELDTFNWLEMDDSPSGASTCQKLPYKCSTKVFEVVLDPEILHRRQRAQASSYPGSIVTLKKHSVVETVKCSSCPRHTKCSCVALVEKLLNIKKEVREFNTGVKVHENGLSLAICGRSVAPIHPMHHPNVVRQLMCSEDVEAEPDDWRQAEAHRFMYFPSPHNPKPQNLIPTPFTLMSNP